MEKNTPIKNDEEIYEQLTGMGKNNDYTTADLLNYEYFPKHYKTSRNRFKQTNWVRKLWFKTTN